MISDVEDIATDLELASKADKAILYFTASWCNPCNKFGPIVKQFKESNPYITVVRIDVDEYSELAELYKIKGVPTVIGLVNGSEVNRHVGATTEEKLKTITENWL